jgi:hypothetical protein
MEMSFFFVEKKPILFTKYNPCCVVTEVVYAIFSLYSLFWSGYCLLSLPYLFVKVSVLPWFPEDYQGGFGVGVVGVPLFGPDWARIASAASP